LPGSQYAGWSLSHGEARALSRRWARGREGSACREELFAELAYKDSAQEICLVLETDKIPPPELADKIARYCSVTPDNVTLVLYTYAQLVRRCADRCARARSGAAQGACPGFRCIRSSTERAAPLPPPSADFITAMGRTNDAILFGGQVHLFVADTDDAAQQLAHALPSSASKDYGKPFARVFKDVRVRLLQDRPAPVRTCTSCR
jgi:methenyltetrahydromethanopterin cyclohydrolase